jgi:hypothetical protein
MSTSQNQLPAQTGFRDYLLDWCNAWNSFWFRPQSPATLGLMRVFVGSIVLYTHLIWTVELTTFLGADGFLAPEYRELLFGNSFAWSHLDWFQSSTGLFAVHVFGLIVIAMFTAGIWSRWTAALTTLLVISYANRASGALFGLDQINVFLCLYLAIGNCGGAFSVDAWLKRRRGGKGAGQGSWTPDTLTNISTRLIQIHMCIVYLFAAIGKLQGDTWFNGEAIWGAFASYEYQTLDMTWLADFMPVVALMTLGALAWELAYPALIWPRLTRPIMLAIAIPVHLGIGICMGMLTFGFIMLVGNSAFIDPAWIERWFSKDDHQRDH